MGRVRHSDTAAELHLRRALHRLGLRYRLRYRLPGSPDVTFVAARIALFVDGCFWHGCPEHGTWPKSNADFWKAKILRNRERDAIVDARVREMGWTPMRIWEHEVRADAIAVAQRVAVVVSGGAGLGHRPRRGSR